ncbi:hypothetical protein NKH18_32210 [Streptomyces sp. M10(2022)]
MTGGVDKYDGWVLLPEKCWTTQPMVVGVSSSEPVSGSVAFAALVTDTARAVAAQAACGDLPEDPGTLLPPRSEAARPVSEGGCVALTASPCVVRCRRTPRCLKGADGAR